MEIVIVVDRSGSMMDIAGDMAGGINKFIEEQKAVDDPGCRLTLAQFDSEYEMVHDGVPIEFVPPYTLHPRSTTALLDAVGKTVSAVRERRPERAICVIVTDGMENASREWTSSAVKSLVECATKDGWEFVYLGADIDAFGEAGAIGVKQGTTANYGKDGRSVNAAFSDLSGKVGTSRLSGASVQSYTSAEREEIKPGEGNTTG
ncbi:MAG: hypothetical protein WBG86_15970 [Polyangiales bacterium]